MSKILEELDNKRRELAQLRMDKVTGTGAAHHTRIRKVRRDIARLSTQISFKRRAALKKHLYKANKGRLPHDMRPKQTRAIRRRLTKEQVNKKTLRAQKQNWAFPNRLYAVKE